MNKIGPNYFSFKDYSARVVFKEGLYRRHIYPEYKLEYDHLMASGLYSKLVYLNLLITHQETDLLDKHSYKIIIPEQIDFISLPFEWCFNQWRKVLLAF